MDLRKDGLPGLVSLSVSLLLTLLGALLFSLVPSFLHLSIPLSSFGFLFLFLHLQFLFFLCVSLSSLVYMSLLPSLFPISEYPPHPFSTSPRNSRVCVDRVNIYSTESSLRRLCLFFFLQLVLGRMSNNEPDPLTWFVASVTDISWPQQHVDNEMLQLSSCQKYWYLI